MKYFFFLFLLVLIITSCASKTKKIPDEKVVEVLADLLLADEIILSFYPEKHDDYRNLLKKKILAIHDLDESDFDTVFTAVQKDLMGYFVIQGKVEDHLKEMKENLESY